MSTYGELIQALKVLKNVKEKRHGIKSLSALCATRAFQVRIVQRGGWRDAILPLIISLDDDCRKYAALAIANLSTVTATHEQLLQEEVLRHLAPILQSEEVQEVVIYVLNALGNFAISPSMWQQMGELGVVRYVSSFVEETDREEILINALFCLSNMTGDPAARAWMMRERIYNKVWHYMTENRNLKVLQYSLTVLRGLAVEPEAQDVLPRLHLIPHLVGIFTSSQANTYLKSVVLDIILHLSFKRSNAGMFLQPTVMAVIEDAARGDTNFEYIPVGVAIIANLCENIEHHDTIASSPLFDIIQSLVQNDSPEIQMHVIRAMMHLALSPKYHHVILSTGVMANVCPIAMNNRFPPELRANSLQMLGAVCATHPTTPTDDDVMNLLFLICNSKEHIEIRRASMMVIANASSDKGNVNTLLNKSYIESLVVTLSKCTDIILLDFLMMFFHNLCKLDNKAGSMMLRCGFEKQVFTFERLESLSSASAIYLCDLCRHLADDTVVRGQLMQEMVLKTMTDAWRTYIEDPEIAPHIALMVSAFAYHSDTHTEFVLQGGVRLAVELYSQSPIEHVRLCCLLTLLYLSENELAQKSIAQERGLMLLLTACENETHVDLVTNAMKALLPFASSDDYRPELGQEGALDTFASYLFSDQLSLQQLGIFLLQNLLELRVNRRIFLGLSDEKKCEEEYLEPLTRMLPKVNRGAPKRIGKTRKGRNQQQEESNLAPHDPFILRTCIHCLALLSLEHNEEILDRFLDLFLPQKFYDIFYSESIDKSAGEAILLFFANVLHSRKEFQSRIMRGLEVIPMLLSARDMDFSPHTITQSLSALLSIARCPDFRRMVVSHLDLIMASVNANLSTIDRDEDFYSAAAVHAALLCELARASTEFHEKMAEAGVIEAFLVLVTVAGKGVNEELCVELLMSAVFGIAALVSSPKTGERCMASLLFPPTRLQLFMSLLRLPAQDINSAYFQGTIGVRQLQRTATPDISPEELQVGSIGLEDFLDRCHVKPSFFLSRNVIRTLCLLLAHPEMAVRVQEAIAPPRVVPTCLSALRDSNDVYVNVYGYLLVATFSKHLSLQPGFVNDASIVNELLTGCRRGSAAAEEEEDDNVPQELENLVKGGGLWTPKMIRLNKYLLSMVALTNFAESIREVYRIDEDDTAPEPGESQASTTSGHAPKLTISNRVFMKKLAAVCLNDLNPEAITTSARQTEAQEFAALLKVIVLHNTFVQRVMLESAKRGGEVKVQNIGMSTEFAPERPTGLALVPKQLRIIFQTLKQLQHKCQGLLDVVEHCLESNRGQQLVVAIIECLSGLTYLSPMVLHDPYSVYRLIPKSPERIHASLMCLLCNSLGDDDRIEKSAMQESGEMVSAPSDFLFPLLATSTEKVRQHTLASLANLGPRRRFLPFILNSGIFRIIKPLLDRAYFIENFGLLIECTRLLTNLTCQLDTHEKIVSENLVGFLRDILRFSAKQVLTDLKGPPRPKVNYEYIRASFEEDDAPPLGLRIRWEVPPYVSAILPGTPAANLENQLMEGDELIEVNGVDVTELEQREIEPRFECRPLSLLFRRTPDRRASESELALAEEEEEEEEEYPRIDRLDTYGDSDQYLECFNLALLTLHNLAINNKNHDLLLAEPKILHTMLDVISSKVLAPSLRRISFSLLTCLAQQKEVAGVIFQDMADYFRSCEAVDTSLQKYTICCANLFYTSMTPEEVVPDIGMLMFVGKLAEMEAAAASNRSLVEVLHGMSRAPIERRAALVCRDVLVTMISFMEQRDQWDVQLRAFEAAYFLTLGGFDERLWSSLELVPRMAKAAGKVREFAGRDPELLARVDGLFELTIRAADICLQCDAMVPTLALPDLDRYLMDLLGMVGKTPGLIQCAAHLMAGLVQSSIGVATYMRWRAMGLPEKVVKWFKNHRQYVCQEEQTRGTHDESVTMGDAVDAVLHFLIAAVEREGDFVTALVGDDVISSIAYRILMHANSFKKAMESGGSLTDMTHVNISFRSIAQLLTIVACNQHGLASMSQLNLAIPLADLLSLPSEDFRIPVLIILCALCAHKDSCEQLVKNETFLEHLRGLSDRLNEPGNVPLLPEEIEYLVCILDRTCCYPDLATIVQKRLTPLLLTLPAKARSMSIHAQLLSIRALTRCALNDPECLEMLPANGIPCMHYLLASIGALRNGVAGKPDSTASVIRRKMIADQASCFLEHPEEAMLIEHFSRTILCEAVSVSTAACQGMFEDLDCMSLIQKTIDSFEASFEKAEAKREEIETFAAEVLNQVAGAMHLLLNVIFRQKVAGKGSSEVAAAIPDTYISKATVELFDALYRYLRLAEFGNPQESSKSVQSVIADKLLSDVRIVFYLTALVREVCVAPLDSLFLQVVRTDVWFDMIQVLVQVSLHRLQRIKQGKPCKSLFSQHQPGGLRESPLLHHLEDFELGHIFEHVLVALRHSLVQAMYVPVPKDELPSRPWLMRAQEKSDMHLNALRWIPEVMQRFYDYPAIKMEVVRYITAVTTFYASPGASWQPSGNTFSGSSPQEGGAEPAPTDGAPQEDAPADGDGEGDGDGDAEAAAAAATAAAATAATATATAGSEGPVDAASPETEPTDKRGEVWAPTLVVDTYHLFQPVVLSLLTEVLENSTDPCALSLAILSISNLAHYEQEQQIKRDGKRPIPLDDLQRLIYAVIRVMKEVPKMSREFALEVMNSAYRFVASMMSFGSIKVLAMLLDARITDAIKVTFDFFFRDPFKITDSKDYVETTKTLLLVLRNWATAGCEAEIDLDKIVNGGYGMSPKEAASCQKIFKEHLNSPALLNLMMKVVFKLIDVPRELPEVDDNFLEYLYQECIVMIRVMLQRTWSRKNMTWETLDQTAFETLLEKIKEHNYQRTQVFEDPEMIHILYLMTKQDFLYERNYFPNFLMDVAYGDHRTGHSDLQDIAAICCAIIATQSSKQTGETRGPMCNILDVVSDFAKFVHQLDDVPDPRMQLWHYRLLVGWSVRPKVLEEVSSDKGALKFVIDRLLDPLLSRYSVLLVHNLSVLRHKCLIEDETILPIVCQAYQNLAPGVTDPETEEGERRLLRRLLLAILRNCLFHGSESQIPLPDSLLEPLVGLCETLDPADMPLYSSALLHLCHQCPPQRVTKHLATNSTLVSLLLETFLSQVTMNGQPINDVRIYEMLTPEEEADAQALVEAGGAGPPTLPTKQQSLAAKAKKKHDARLTDAGIGKGISLYQQMRMKRQVRAYDGGELQSTQAAVVSREQKNLEQEWVYFAASEILTHITFKEEEGVPLESEDVVLRNLQAAFQKHPIAEFLKAIEGQVKLHERGHRKLTDFFMQVTLKFIWHCWAMPMFRPFFNSPSNLETLATLMPVFLGWPDQEVQHLSAEAALFSNMHRYASMQKFLIDGHREFPELACAALTKALVDEEAVVKARQAAEFLNAFLDLLRHRTLSRTGLHRMAVGLMIGLINEHPEGFGAYLLAKEPKVLAQLLEVLSGYCESATVKQCLVVILISTAGQHYKALPELDDFVLRIFDMAGPLLEGEFLLFFPVIYRLVSVGGKRTKAPLLARQLHMRVARLFEVALFELEHEDDAKEEWEASEKVVIPEGMHLTPRQKVQWMLAFFATLTSGWSPSNPKGSGQDQDLLFDAFVCVDLLPLLVRAIQKDPFWMETMTISFLLSSVATSPCLIPHMPDLLRLSERVFPTLIEPEGARARAVRNRMASELKIGNWEHLRIPNSERAEAAVRRSFVHLLANASAVPTQNPAILAAPKVLEYLGRLDVDADMFEDPAAPLHTRVYALAKLCALADKQSAAMDLDLLQILKVTEERISTDMAMSDEVSLGAPDLRIPWIHCVVSLIKHSGPKLLDENKAEGLGIHLMLRAMQLAAGVLGESLATGGRGGGKHLHLAMECHQALTFAIVKLCTRLDFGPVRAEFSYYLLTLMCSAPLLAMRTSACENLTTVLTQGYDANVVGATFLKTPCLISFRQMVAGPLDELAIGTVRVMQALGQFGGYDCHVHLLPNLEGSMAALGDPNSSAQRCIQLAELFVTLAKARTPEVLDTVMEMSNITPFLGLGRSSQASRRELVLRWLESFGSSLYEIDEVTEIFSKSTMRGLLHLAARSTLPPEQAQDLRRVLFGLIQKRVDVWRGSMFGVREFLSESLISALLPLCEKQSDLVGAAVSLFHTCMRNGDLPVLERIWQGGHFDWLCQRLSTRSRAQLYSARATTGEEPTTAMLAKAWEKHTDLIAAQAMMLRVLWQLYKMNPTETGMRAVNGGCLVKVWGEYFTYYMHYPWPLRENREVEESTTCCLILAMQLFARLARDVNAELQQKMIKQGAMSVCLTVLLPPPPDCKQMEDAVYPRPGAEPEDRDCSESLLLPEARLIAGAVASWLLQHVDGYSWLKDRRNAGTCRSMLFQLHHWRDQLIEQQGSISVLATVAPLERYASLYLVLLSSLQIEWYIDNFGVGFMAALMPLFLSLWSKHANVVIKHHSLRLFSLYCQSHHLYASAFCQEDCAKAVTDSMHSTFGTWDVRALRHVLRILCAGLAHALSIPVLPMLASSAVVQSLRRERECKGLVEMVQDSGILRANIMAGKYLMKSRFLAQLITWSENPGDSFSRTWVLWIILTLLRFEKKVAPTMDDNALQEQGEALFEYGSNSDENHVLRRARLKKEAMASGVGLPPGSKDSCDDGLDLAGAGQQKELPQCRLNWLRATPVLQATLAEMVGKTLELPWKAAQILSCASAARLFYELPEFQQEVVEAMKGELIVSMFKIPDKKLNLVATLVTALLSSYRLQLKAANITGDFLRHFYDLASKVIEGFSACGDGPYDLVARWLHLPERSLPCEVAFRTMISYIVGQCVAPPLAVVPSLELEGMTQDGAHGSNAPPVAECEAPPAALLDKLAYEIIREEQRLKRSQVDFKGPLFSTLLCHLLYALAVIVPLHPRVAANSPTVRGAAFAQLMKVQNMVANSVQPPALYDPADGSRAKLFLYIRATACIRSALQVITASWPAADFGPRFSIGEEGGKDFIQYCTKHINQVYNNKTALTRVLGTPWERLMLSQGPTLTIAELLLNICSTDANLKEMSRLGGEQALHSLGRYGESAQIRQQATMLLTKLAVMQAG